MTCSSCEPILADMAAQRKTHHQTAHSMSCKNEALRLEIKKLKEQLEKMNTRKALSSLSPAAGLMLAYNYLFGKK